MKYFWYKIWVIIFTESEKLSYLGVPWVRNNPLLLDFFWTFKNPIGHLNLWCTVWQDQDFDRYLLSRPTFLVPICHEIFFLRPKVLLLIPRPSKNWQMSRNRYLTLWYILPSYFYANMNVSGDDHQGTKVELARDGEEVHCWQTSLEEVVASVFGVCCISVFAWKIKFVYNTSCEWRFIAVRQVWKKQCIWIFVSIICLEIKIFSQ